MGRFYNTDKSTFNEKGMYLAPWDRIEKVIERKDANADAAIVQGNAVDLTASMIEHLDNDVDRKNAEGVTKKYQDKVEGIIQNILENAANVSGYKGQLSRIGKDIVQDKSTGLWSSIENRAKERAAYIKANEATRLLEPETYDRKLKAYDKDIEEKTKADANAKSSFTSVATKPLLDTSSDLFKSITDSISSVKRGKFIQKDTFIEKSRVVQIGVEKIQSDPNFMTYAKQQASLGFEGYLDSVGKPIPLYVLRNTATGEIMPIETDIENQDLSTLEIAPNPESAYYHDLGAYGETYRKDQTEFKQLAQSRVIAPKDPDKEDEKERKDKNMKSNMKLETYYDKESMGTVTSNMFDVFAMGTVPTPSMQVQVDRYGKMYTENVYYNPKAIAKAGGFSLTTNEQGKIVDVDFNASFDAWGAGSPEEELKETFLTCAESKNFTPFYEATEKYNVAIYKRDDTHHGEEYIDQSTAIWRPWRKLRENLKNKGEDFANELLENNRASVPVTRAGYGSKGGENNLNIISDYFKDNQNMAGVKIAEVTLLGEDGVPRVADRNVKINGKGVSENTTVLDLIFRKAHVQDLKSLVKEGYAEVYQSGIGTTGETRVSIRLLKGLKATAGGKAVLNNLLRFKIKPDSSKFIWDHHSAEGQENYARAHVTDLSATFNYVSSLATSMKKQQYEKAHSPEGADNYVYIHQKYKFPTRMKSITFTVQGHSDTEMEILVKNDKTGKTTTEFFNTAGMTSEENVLKAFFGMILSPNSGLYNERSVKRYGRYKKKIESLFRQLDYDYINSNL